MVSSEAIRPSLFAPRMRTARTAWPTKKSSFAAGVAFVAECSSMLKREPRLSSAASEGMFISNVFVKVTKSDVRLSLVT